MKKMSRTCRTYGREKGWGNFRERDHLKDYGADTSIIFRWIFRKGDGGKEWTGLMWLMIGIGGWYWLTR
jgi:hypothetical protein